MGRAVLASIPSPHSNVVDLGPLTIHMYGLMLLLAIFACVWLTAVRWRRLGGDFDLVVRVTVWGVVLFGTLAGVIVIRRSGNSARLFMDAVAPGLLLAQGIGRIGNWWNQELYGKVTTLPWGLEIDPAHFVNPNQVAFVHGHRVLFHPTFLYELIWDVV